MTEKESSIILSLPHMVDLALGSPEVGAVNFNVLHSLLHVMLQQMDLRKTQVEFRGPDCDRIRAILQTAPKTPTLKLSEYTISLEDSAANLAKMSSRDKKRTDDRKQNEKHQSKANKDDANTDKSKTESVRNTKKTEVQQNKPIVSNVGNTENRTESSEDKNKIEGKHKKSNKDDVSNIENKVQSSDNKNKIDGDHKNSNENKEKNEDEKKKRKEDKRKETEGKANVILVEQVDDDKKGKVIERVVDKTLKSKVSKEALDKMEEKVQHLEKQVSEMQSLSSNEVLINRSRSTSQSTPVNDMWQIMNLTKRMDAAETCINKLTSMVEDIAKGVDTTTLHAEVDKTSQKEPTIFERIVNLENRVTNVEHTTGVANHRVAVAIMQDNQEAKGEGVAIPTAIAPTDYIETTVDELIISLRGELSQVRNEVDNISSHIHQVKSITDLVPVQLDTLTAGIKEIDELRGKFEELSAALREGSIARGSITPEEAAAGHAQQERINELEQKLNECAQQMEGIDSSISTQMNTVQDQISELEKELGEILEKVNGGMPMGDSFSQDFSGLSELYNKIQILQGDMENLNQTATRLMDDREERQLHIEALLEQIEVLKTIKADREDLEEALADKADQNIVNRKVSHDQFDAVYDDLSRGLEEALTKLSVQETLWRQSIDDVQQEIQNKLDKIELSPLKDFVNSKLKALQDKLKALANMRKDAEAAGTKLRILRNVNCISCDADVVMKTQLDVPSIPAPDPLPPNRSMKPYLTYELDQVRKQQRRPQGKNMLYLEEAEREQQSRRMKGKGDAYQDAKFMDHLCNRYCGGSHTITTPQQRVARMGHFLTQWGPEAIQLTEGTIRGTDGLMYRARAMPPQYPTKTKKPSKAESPVPTKSPSKQPSLSSPTAEKRTSPTLSSSPKIKTSATSAPPSSPVARDSTEDTRTREQKSLTVLEQSSEVPVELSEQKSTPKLSPSSPKQISSPTKVVTGSPEKLLSVTEISLGSPKQKVSMTKTSTQSLEQKLSPTKVSLKSPEQKSSIIEVHSRSPEQKPSAAKASEQTVSFSELPSRSPDKQSPLGSPEQKSSMTKAATQSPEQKLSPTKISLRSQDEQSSVTEVQQRSPEQKSSTTKAVPDAPEQKPSTTKVPDAPEQKPSTTKVPDAPEQKTSSTKFPSESPEKQSPSGSPKQKSSDTEAALGSPERKSSV